MVVPHLMPPPPRMRVIGVVFVKLMILYHLRDLSHQSFPGSPQVKYKANGQVKEAVTLLEEVVTIKGQTLVEDHSDRLASQHALVGVYEANGQVKGAVVRIQGQTLAEDHPSRLASKHDLAVYYWQLDRQEDALKMMEYLVRIQKDSLKEHHPDQEGSEAWLKHFERSIDKR